MSFRDNLRVKVWRLPLGASIVARIGAGLAASFFFYKALNIYLEGFYLRKGRYFYSVEVDPLWYYIHIGRFIIMGAVMVWLCICGIKAKR